MKAAGEFAQTNQILEKALRHTSEWVGDHDIYAVLVDMAADRREQEELWRLAPLADESARRYNHQLYIGVALRSWGVLHLLQKEYEQADTRFKQAADIFEKLGTKWQLGKTYTAWGELARERGQESIASALLQKAKSAFRELRSQ